MREIPLRWMPGGYSVCKLSTSSDNGFEGASSQSFVSMTRAGGEVSVVVPEGEEPAGATCESGWIGCVVVGPLSFDLVGILARLTAALAAANVPVFVLSTFETDYLFVKAAHAHRAQEALSTAPQVTVQNAPPLE